MKRTERMDWYVDRLVRLTTGIKTGRTTYAPGRVFRVYGHYRGRANLEAPDYDHCPLGYRPLILKVPFSYFELLPGDATGYCRVCGCTDRQACPGGCSWTAPGLCSRCAPAIGAKHG